MKKQYYEIRTVPKYNKKINRKKKEAKQKALRHMTTHSHGLVETLL